MEKTISIGCRFPSKFAKSGALHMTPTQLQDDSVVAALARGYRRHQESLAAGRP